MLSRSVRRQPLPALMDPFTMRTFIYECTLLTQAPFFFFFGQFTEQLRVFVCASQAHMSKQALCNLMCTK